MNQDGVNPVINQTEVNKSKNTGRFQRIGMVLVCLLAGIGGGWSYDELSSRLENKTSSVTESRQKVIAEGEVVADIAKKVSPSVVSIVTKSTVSDGFLRNAGSQEAAGTGIVISNDGYILTNRHVIPATTSGVQIVTTDGTTYDKVKVVGRDKLNDLAFLKIDNVSNLTPANLGNAGDLVVGGKVVAIGNALGEYNTTVTSGIISGLNRTLMATDDSGDSAESLSGMIQTDAAINPGNSGGPLVDINGNVVGINTAVSQDAQGIGFAIPIDYARGLIKSVLNTGKLQRAYLGVRYITITPEVAKRYDLAQKAGAYVINEDSADGLSGPAVVRGSPADKAGIQSGDIITKVNSATLSDSVLLGAELSNYSVGDTIKLTIIRDGKEKIVSVKLDELT